MKILYTTDLHGRQHYYNQIWKKALEHKVDMIINGADMLPKTNPVFKQQLSFIKNLEKHYFPKIEKAKIHYLCTFGNDDLRIYDDFFDDVCSRFEYIHNIAGRCIEIDNIFFVGLGLCVDYPFGLKDRCLRDKEGFEFPEQRGNPAFSVKKGNGYGWDEMTKEEWFAHARTLPTLEDELNALPRPKDMKKAVYVIHMPPAGLGLDVCSNGDRPESKSVFEFLQKKEQQPLISLHGHIHENFKMTGIWKANIGKTIAVQPGQGGMHPVYVIMDTEDLGTMKRYGHDTETLMVKAYVPEEGIPYVRISELPEYLQEPFLESLMGQGMRDYPGEKPFNTPFARDFDNFCLSKGIKIKLIKVSVD